MSSHLGNAETITNITIPFQPSLHWLTTADAHTHTHTHTNSGEQTINQNEKDRKNVCRWKKKKNQVSNQ